jgi:hypothetical protein
MKRTGVDRLEKLWSCVWDWKAGAVVGAAFPQHFLPKAIEGSTEDDSNDVTGGREGWKKLGMPEESG